MTKAVKHDAEKPPYDLLAPEYLEATSEVLGFGAKKYGSRNWEFGMAWSRPFFCDDAAYVGMVERRET